MGLVGPTTATPQSSARRPSALSSSLNLTRSLKHALLEPNACCLKFGDLAPDITSQNVAGGRLMPESLVKQRFDTTFLSESTKFGSEATIVSFMVDIKIMLKKSTRASYFLCYWNSLLVILFITRNSMDCCQGTSISSLNVLKGYRFLWT
jgi:hypothetical protein